MHDRLLYNSQSTFHTFRFNEHLIQLQSIFLLCMLLHMSSVLLATLWKQGEYDNYSYTEGSKKVWLSRTIWPVNIRERAEMLDL